MYALTAVLKSLTCEAVMSIDTLDALVNLPCWSTVNCGIILGCPYVLAEIDVSPNSKITAASSVPLFVTTNLPLPESSIVAT